MRTSRYILYTALLTVFSLLYVFQQTEITKAGYKITEAQQASEACLDHGTVLEYTLSALESPVNFDKNLFFKKDQFELASGYMLVKIAPITGAAAQASVLAPGPFSLPLKRLALKSWFAAKEAQAKTIK